MLAKMQRKGNPLTLLVGMQTGTAILKNSMEVPKKLKIELPYKLAVKVLHIYPKNTKTLIERDTCSPMFIAVLLMVAKICKQPKCPPLDEWIKK